MSKIFLIAETPRAGKWNHRYLVAVGNTLSESVIANFVRSARDELIGKNYIAVEREVFQEQSGRTGKETLLLIGVDTKHLSDTQKLKISSHLEVCLKEDLDHLISTIPWESTGKNLVVESPELSKWCEQFSELPNIEIAETNVLIERPELIQWHEKFSSFPRVQMTKTGRFIPLFSRFSFRAKLIMTIGAVVMVIAMFTLPSWMNSNGEQKQGNNPFSPEQEGASEEKIATISTLNKWLEEAKLAPMTKDDLQVILSALGTFSDGSARLVDEGKIKLWDSNKKTDLALATILISDKHIDEYLKLDKDAKLATIVQERDIIRNIYRVLRTNTPKQCEKIEQSTSYPYLRFVCTLVIQGNNCSDSCDDDNNKSLIFFSKNDLIRAKTLTTFYKNGINGMVKTDVPNKKLSDKLCELIEREKDSEASDLRQKSREDKMHDENTITDRRNPWTTSLEQFYKGLKEVSELCKSASTSDSKQKK